MKRIVPLLLLAILGLQAVEPAFAGRRVVVRKSRHRTTVVVHRGWPLRRPARLVVVRPARVAVRVTPVVYLPLVVWTGAVVAVATAPGTSALAWEDGEILSREEGWTELTLNANSRGTNLWLQVAQGRVQFDWAEVVFENGDARVVDMREGVRDPGLYHLLDFRDGRAVDHVRLVARAHTNESRIVLRMEK
jgi:hypothetical protein